MSERFDDDFGAFVADAESRRRHRRWFVDFKTTITVGDAPASCTVIDLSPGGACVEPEAPQNLVLGDQVEFLLPGFGSIAAEVHYSGEGYLGLMFLQDEEGEIELARYLVAVEQNRPQKRHEFKLDATLRASGIDSPCIVEDISRHGARILIDDPRHILQDQAATLEVPRLGAIAATVQRIEDGEIGLLFLQELAEDPHEALSAPVDAP